MEPKPVLRFWRGSSRRTWLFHEDILHGILRNARHIKGERASIVPQNPENEIAGPPHLAVRRSHRLDDLFGSISVQNSVRSHGPIFGDRSNPPRAGEYINIAFHSASIVNIAQHLQPVQSSASLVDSFPSLQALATLQKSSISVHYTPCGPASSSLASAPSPPSSYCLA